jgi:hypothetical protein
MIEGTYVSGDACERADAYRFGHRQVCWHPNEVGSGLAVSAARCTYRLRMWMKKPMKTSTSHVTVSTFFVKKSSLLQWPRRIQRTRG